MPYCSRRLSGFLFHLFLLPLRHPCFAYVLFLFMTPIFFFFMISFLGIAFFSLFIRARAPENLFVLFFSFSFFFSWNGMETWDTFFYDTGEIPLESWILFLVIFLVFFLGTSFMEFKCVSLSWKVSICLFTCESLLQRHDEYFVKMSLSPH